MTDKILSFPIGPEGSGPQGEPPEFKLPETICVWLDIQRGRLFDALAIVQTAAAGIAREYDCERMGSVDFPRALKVAVREIDEVAGLLEPGWLPKYAATAPEVLAEIKRVAELREGAE